MIRHLFLSLSLVLISAPVLMLRAQAVSVPLRHEIYGFLKKMESKGVITDYHDIIRPISRSEAAKQLLRISSQTDELTSVDIRRLTFLQEEFGYELGFYDSSWTEAPRRWHLLTFPITGGVLNVDPLLGYSEKRLKGERGQKITNGLNVYGYAFGKLGVLFTFADNHEQGQLADRAKALSPDDGVHGFITSKGSKVFGYDFTEAQFSYATDDILVSLEKVPQSWATGRRGSISLSSKAPSAPQLRFAARITDWMTFTYVHAELNSRILDSARSYPAYSSQVRDFFREVYRQKYFAGHMLEITPIDGLDVALGESIIYSDRNPSLMYLLPVMFFKSGEHYNNDTDNTQFHISADLTMVSGLNIYGSIIIDEIVPSKIFSSPSEARNQLGYTVGLQAFDLPIDNLETTIEYSRLNPWVYSHKYPSATFTNNGYDMGHWIGQNADNLFMSATYWFARELNCSAWVELFRKGGIDDVAFQYTFPSKEFLYGPRRTERSIGASIRYQPVRDLHLTLDARTFSLSNEADPINDHGQELEIIATLRYGVW